MTRKHWGYYPTHVTLYKDHEAHNDNIHFPIILKLQGHDLKAMNLKNAVGKLCTNLHREY